MGRLSQNFSDHEVDAMANSKRITGDDGVDYGTQPATTGSAVVVEITPSNQAGNAEPKAAIGFEEAVIT